MPDWTNPEAYAFTAELDRSGWAWEFMRRNPTYRTEFANLGTAKNHYDPPKKDAETERAWLLRVTASGGEPLRSTPYELFARKWRVIPPIHDPASSEPPEFDVFPTRPLFDEVKQYFSDEHPYPQVGDFAVLVFDLRSSPVIAQLERAEAHLLARQKASNIKKLRPIWPRQWTTYLRLVDADLAGAKSKEIRAKLEEYLPESDDADHKHKAADKFADHRRYAFALRDDPLSILIKKSP